MKIPSLFAACAFALTLSPAHSAEAFDFDVLTEADIKVGPSQNAEGSAISLAEDPATGSRTLKCIYNIAGDKGYAEFVFNEKRLKPRLPTTGRYKISFRVRGNEEVQAGPVGLRLVDARGEVHQYMLPGLEGLLKKPEWSQYETVLDLSASETHWGAESDGVVDTPAALYSFAVNGGRDGDSGTLHFDDLQFEPAD
jgi:hypothetical protein